MVENDDENEDWSQERYITMAHTQATQFGGFNILTAPEWLAEGIAFVSNIQSQLMEATHGRS